MESQKHSYFSYVSQDAGKSNRHLYQAALDRCVARLRDTLPIHGLRNPKIGVEDNSWSYCGPFDWVVSFQSGQLWLAYQLSGDSAFRNSAQARRPVFRNILRNRTAQDHDLGFQYSLSCVADWLMTSDAEARSLALDAATLLLGRHRQEGKFLQAWNPQSVHGEMRAQFANGRIIADTMQNLALLYWAYGETGRLDFKIAADEHANTSLNHLIRQDNTSFHTFVFDPSSGAPIGGQTHQGFADHSCWSRGQAWLIHGFAQCAATTGNSTYLDAAKRLAAKAKQLMGTDTVPVWDYSVPEPNKAPRDSSAGAIMAAGLLILAGLCENEEAAQWRSFADRLLNGLLESCDLTNEPDAHGLLAHGAAHVTAGFSDNMLPYGDYYFMEALMRALGHDQFFW